MTFCIRQNDIKQNDIQQKDIEPMTFTNDNMQNLSKMYVNIIIDSRMTQQNDSK